MSVSLAIWFDVHDVYDVLLGTHELFVVLLRLAYCHVTSLTLLKKMCDFSLRCLLRLVNETDP